MTTTLRTVAGCLLAVVLARAGAVELKVSREALERTLRQQLFSGPEGRYYIKGSDKSACFVYAEDARLTFAPDGRDPQGEPRIVVNLKTRARLGKQMGGACVGISLSLPAEVSLAPVGEGESVGFRDARIDRVSDRQELNFILMPFLSRQIPSGLKVNAAELLRKALEGSTATSGYKVALDKLQIHSARIVGDDLVVDVDGALSVK